jgi:hypothetical protein
VLETYDVSKVVANSFDAGAAAPPAPVVATSRVGPNCVNALVGARLTVEYDVATDDTKLTTITGASLVLLVNPNLAPSATLRYRRSFSVRYVQKGSVAAGLPNDVSSSLTAQRAGSPGYVAGRPLLAGYAAVRASAGQEAVQVAPGGFAIPIGGSCTAAAARFGAVPFMHDVSAASCYMDISLAALQNTYCVNGAGPTLLDSVLKPASCGGSACPINTTLVNRIGRDGDARYNVSQDWITVADADRETVLSGDAPVYDTKSARCNGLVTGLHWTFGVARGGATYNPQDVIVAARVKPIVGSWAWAPNGGATTRVRYSFKVSFVRIPTGGSITMQQLKPPPFFPEVDDDVFYPFRRPPG